jgi:hypothetical protein
MTRLLATLRWRHLRWTAVAAVIPVLWACDARRLAKPGAAPAVIQQKKFAQTVNHKLDLLFMIDDSNSMAPLQTKMAARLPDFMTALKDPTTQQLPDLHVGVVSSSLGAGAWGGVPQCGGGYPGSDDGKFQQGPGGAQSGSCVGAGLKTGATYLVSGDGTSNNPPNFTGNIGDVFACMALLGDKGCGFESQFESVHLALQRAGTSDDPDNGGFLRPDAYLAIVMFTNEDDCSVSGDSLLLDPTHTRVDDPTSNLGGLQSYRCNEFGHVCGSPAAPPPHTATVGTNVTLDNCVSAENMGQTEMPIETNPTNGQSDPTSGHLTTVADFTTFIQGLKDDPNKILVAAIAGPPTPYVVDGFMNQAAQNEVQPEVKHSCTQGTGGAEYADPAVRIAQWVNNFGGVFKTMCADSYQDAMGAIAAAIQQKLGASCIAGNYAKKADGTPDCQVTENVTTNGVTMPMTIPYCGGGMSTTCWTLHDQDGQCTTASAKTRFEVCVNGQCGAPPANTSMEERNANVSCALM